MISKITFIGLCWLVMITLPESIHCECVFGTANTTNQLLTRNSTILNIMNDTFWNYTNSARDTILNYSKFHLDVYLKTQVPASDYLKQVSNGLLFEIDWITASRGYPVDNTFNDTISSYILNQYAKPVHAALQDLASYYRISYGIFRPKPLDFVFTGLIGGSVLGTDCFARSVFMWRITVDITFTSDFTNYTKRQFATFASMIESTFDQYYREISDLKEDFVRVNVISTSIAEDATHLTGYMEAYFLNATFSGTYVHSSTDLSKLADMHYDNGTSKGSNNVQVHSADTSIVSSSYFSHPTTEKSTASTTLITSKLLSTLTPSSNTPKTTTISDPTSSSSTTASALPTQTPSTIASETTAQAIPSTTLSATATTVPGTQSTQGTPSTPLEQTTLFLTLTSSTESVLPSATFIPGVSQSPQAVSTLITAQTSSNVMASTKETTSAISETAMPVQTQSFQTISSSVQSTINNATVLTAGATFVSNSNNVSIAPVNQVANSITPFPNGTFPSESNSLNGTAFTNGSSTTNQNTKLKGSTTFDPDSLFKAFVPVVKKVYNDKILLRGNIDALDNIIEDYGFFYITIPATIGIVSAILICMFVWQIDCERKIPASV